MLTLGHPSVSNLSATMLFTVAQVGPPSFPVPGTLVSRTEFGSACIPSIIAQVIPLNGIFNRRLQHESV